MDAVDVFLNEEDDEDLDVGFDVVFGGAVLALVIRDAAVVGTVVEVLIAGFAVMVEVDLLLDDVEVVFLTVEVVVALVVDLDVLFEVGLGFWETDLTLVEHSPVIEGTALIPLPICMTCQC